jgi:hypothetical protein
VNPECIASDSATRPRVGAVSSASCGARILAALIATAGVALLAAGCGGSSAPHVARIGSAATRSSANGSAGSSGAVAFSRCVRSHGVPTYPDPAGGGRLPKKTPQQLGVSPSVFQAARDACIHLVPNGGEPTSAQVQQYRSVMVIYARCIRSHGVSNMPDPDNRGHLDIGPGSGVDVDGPTFVAAYHACKSKLSP